MRNKKLIPFEVIEKAVAGEPEAIKAVLQHYSPRIKYPVQISRTYQRRYSRPSESTAYQSYPAIPF